MKRKKLLAAVLITLAVVGGACGIGYAVLRTTSTSKAVRVISVRDNRETMISDDMGSGFEGTVSGEAAQNVFVSSAVAVQEVLVKEGQEVKQGDILLTYDTTETDLKLRKLRIEEKRLALQTEVAERNLATLNSLYPYYEGGGLSGGGDEGGAEEFDEDAYLDAIAEELAGLDDEQLEKTLIKTLAKLNPRETIKLLNMLMEAHRGEVLKKVIGEMTMEKQAELLTEITVERDGGIMDLFLASFTDEALAPVAAKALPGMDRPSILWTYSQMKASGREKAMGDGIARMDVKEQSALVPALSQMTAGELAAVLGSIEETADSKKLTGVLTIKDKQGKISPVQEMLSGIRTDDPEKYEGLLSGLSDMQRETVIRLCGKPSGAEPTDTPEPTNTPAPTDTPVPTESPEPTDTPVPTETPEPTEAPVPTEVPQPTDTSAPTETPVPTETPGTSSGSTSTSSASAEGLSTKVIRNLVLPIRPALAGDSSGSGSSLIRPDAQYSAEELANAKKEVQSTLRELELQKRELKLKIDAAGKALNDGQVTAKYDGVVTKAGDPEEQGNPGEPLVTVIGNAGTFVTGQLGEVMLETVKEGSACMVMDGMTGMSYAGVITEISEFPSRSTDGAQYMDMQSPSQSFYPVTIVIEDKEAQMANGSWVSIMPVAGEESVQEDTDKIYFWKAMFIQEGGSAYAYVRGEDGRLVRREVKLGKLLWDYYYEVQSGLSLDDWIAFPYGAAEEGAETVESTMAELYEE